MSPKLTFSAFLDASATVSEMPDCPTLEFSGLGSVEITTVTKANLALLRRAQSLGVPGLLICCPDFEREAIAISFLAALQHIEFDTGQTGLHEVSVNEKVAVGNCVVEITEIDDEKVMYTSADGTSGILKSIREFPLAHRASPDAELSRTKSTKKRKYPTLMNEEERYEKLPMPQRHILDLCGKNVPSVGYVTSPSQYANIAPTRLLNGCFSFGASTCELSKTLPITYLSPKNVKRNSFDWPFDCPPSILVGPRVDGVGSASQILGMIDEGNSIDFVSLNIPNPDLMDTTLLTDILCLQDRGIGVIAFCDRWTLGRLKPLVDNGFLPFDWGNCNIATNAQGLSLSPNQYRMLAGQHEKVLVVPDGDSGLARAKQILYGGFSSSDIDDEEVLWAFQDLFSSLGAAIRMTEAPDGEYSNRQQGLIDEALDTIRASRVLSQQDFDEVSTACDILSAFFEQGYLTPKEQSIYDLITGFLDNNLPVVLVVDRNRTTAAYDYWCGELTRNEYDTELFSVMTTREFLRSNSLSGEENIIFSGWYDKGTMDRCLHSGIAANMIFVLYGHNGEDMEREWWLRANEQWRKEADKCALASDKTLTQLGIEPLNRPNTAQAFASKPRGNDNGVVADKPPTEVVSTIEKRRMQSELALDGERSTPAVPVMFHDGSHSWLKAEPNQTRGGRLLVITDCLTGRDNEPDHKPASALLPGDVVLRTQSDRRYIRKASESSTEGYDDTMALAQKWKEPIKQAKLRGYTDTEIIDRIYFRVSDKRTKSCVRGWVKGYRIAPQTQDDIKAVYLALGCPIDDEELERISTAVGKIRSKHRAVGRMARKGMVTDFLNDVEKYGLDDAIDGFGDRHEAGDVKLLRVTAVGERKNVAVDRVDVL